MHDQLELITLSVTPEEARMLCTACVDNALRLSTEQGVSVRDTLAGKYVRLSEKVSGQALLS
jgi:hypothetical protein